MDRDQVIRWWADAETSFGAIVAEVADDELAAPSLLPDWSRGTVVAHVARNADALGNLLHWARTGEERPMYPSLEAREEGIRASAAQDPPALRADLAEASERFSAAVRTLPETAWSATLRTAMGREITAAGVPWMRIKEVVLHGLDLDAGLDLGRFPDPLLAAVVDEIIDRWTQRDQVPDVCLAAGGHRWLAGAVTISADLGPLVSLLTGRADRSAVEVAGGDLPELPSWM